MAEKPFDEKFVKDFTFAMAGNSSKYEIAALSSLQGLYIQRIFNDRKATDGTSLGKYKSISHIIKRKAAGRQTAEKDLEFYGNLRKSIKIGTSGNLNVMGFVTDISRLIAEGQEAQLKKEVFKVSDEEVDESWNTYRAALESAINRF
jgi:hypothetical protein